MSASKKIPNTNLKIILLAFALLLGLVLAAYLLGLKKVPAPEPGIITPEEITEKIVSYQTKYGDVPVRTKKEIEEIFKNAPETKPLTAEEIKRILSN